MLDFETGILQYFVNEQSKNQKPRGTLSLAGAIISPGDEVPHMLVVYSANGEMYKLRGIVMLKVPFFSPISSSAFPLSYFLPCTVRR